MNQATSRTELHPSANLQFAVIIYFVVVVAPQILAAQSTTTLPQTGPGAPLVNVIRDDLVATLELDYEPGNPWTPFELGENGEGPVGYVISWKVARDPSSRFRSKITSLRRTQIQPLKNDTLYFVCVQCINRFGQIVGSPAQGIVAGGDSSRVANLRNEMTGFFDDFNLPAGLPDETKWNTTFSQTNDPDMQAFFINPQFHTHTLIGTPRMELFGDRGQTTHRIRNKLVLGKGDTRRIVFDIDGVNFANRAIWYLDVVPQEVEITSHVNVGGGIGFRGHPANGIRFFLAGQKAAVYTLNSAGEQLLIQENNFLDFDGVQTFPNVRRSVEIQLSENNVSMAMDGVTILESELGNAALEPTDYTVLWSAFGYNTMKVAMPYFLIHWDNFGFDGPCPTSVVHNYRTQIAGTDLVRSDNYSPQSVEIEIPDKLQPIDNSEVTARLVFTRQMNNWDAAQWSPLDTVTINGFEFSIPMPNSNASPPLELNDLINTNAAYSTYLQLGSPVAGNSVLQTGTNTIIFESAACAYHNVHIEIEYQAGSQPAYTPPQEIHSVPLHHDFPRVGLPARIASIGDFDVDPNPWYSNSVENFNHPVSGSVDVTVLVNARPFNASDDRLQSDFTSACLAAAGENPGISQVEFWIRPENGDASTAVMLGSLQTDADYPAPQLIHKFPFDSTNFVNGVYEISVLATDSRGIKSLPEYGGVGEQVEHSDQLNGFYYPLHVTVNN